MKAFFKTCLEELELKTGIKQLHWLRQSCEDQADFDRKKAILLDSMVSVSEQFAYIGKEDQKRIISSMITKDQDYDALNARSVWKWLNMYKDHFYNANKVEEIPQVVTTPEEDERIREISNNWLASLAGNFSPQYGDLGQEIKRIVQEDKDRSEKKKASGYVPLSREEVLMRDLHIEWIRLHHDPITKERKENWISEDEWLKLQTI